MDCVIFETHDMFRIRQIVKSRLVEGNDRERDIGQTLMAFLDRGVKVEYEIDNEGKSNESDNA